MSKESLLSFSLDYLKDKEDFVFLWNGRADSDNYQSYIFTSPIEIIQCHDKHEIIEAFSNIEKYQKDGHYLAGFISYEAGLCFEKVFSFADERIGQVNVPLLWFGVYDKPIIYDHKAKFFNNEDMNVNFAQYASSEKTESHIEKINNTVRREVYIHNVEFVRDAIARGETYQVNYTFKHKFNLVGNPMDFFFSLCMKQSASYSAFIRCKDHDVLSLSPELFFRRMQDNIITKPMKGTIKRGVNSEDDLSKAEELHDSIKDRAENVMIVDLLRNDLGRISNIGSVKVDKLFEVERYETLFQMTSTIHGEFREDVSWLTLFKSMFPCGSVTGAPKISTMNIINNLEKEPRGIYTGGIGYIAPDNESIFSVAIRTVVLDRLNQKCEMGIGSGIVHDSRPVSEYDECLLKADFLTTKYKDFQLIETLLWQDGEFFLLDLHIKRLRESAEYFLFECDTSKVIKVLNQATKKFENNKKYRVRLLLFRDGNITVSSSELDDIGSQPKQVVISKHRIDQTNRFFYHKTTNRDLYDSELKKVREKGYYDVLFINSKDEVTEGAISNIFIKNGERFFTPPIACGLLNGVYRRFMFEKGFPLEEKVLFEKDLFEADKVYLANSVRGVVEAKIVKDS
jgi:para-aminobenzoate synthetase/4-amino-4-deoxychorismate lyase